MKAFLFIASLLVFWNPSAEARKKRIAYEYQDQSVMEWVSCDDPSAERAAPLGRGEWACYKYVTKTVKVKIPPKSTRPSSGDDCASYTVGCWYD